MKNTKTQRLEELQTEHVHVRLFVTCLASLSLNQIKMLEYKYVDGMTLDQISKMYNLTVERVRQIINQSKQVIVAKYNQEPEQCSPSNSTDKLKSPTSSTTPNG